MQPKSRTALRAGAALLVATALAVALTAAASASSESAQRHHSHVLHAAQVRHAAHVRAADHRRSHARWEAQRLAASHGYGESWWTTRTPSWACIRLREGGGSYLNWSGAYGFLAATAASFGFPYPMGGVPPDRQDAAALTLLHRDGWAPWSTARACGLLG